MPALGSAREPGTSLASSALEKLLQGQSSSPRRSVGSCARVSGVSGGFLNRMGGKNRALHESQMKAINYFYKTTEQLWFCSLEQTAGRLPVCTVTTQELSATSKYFL